MKWVHDKAHLCHAASYCMLLSFLIYSTGLACASSCGRCGDNRRLGARVWVVKGCAHCETPACAGLLRHGYYAVIIHASLHALDAPQCAQHRERPWYPALECLWLKNPAATAARPSPSPPPIPRVSHTPAIAVVADQPQETRFRLRQDSAQGPRGRRSPCGAPRRAKWPRE